MEQIETVDLDIDESNELAFKIKMEGVGTNPVKVRLVCESSEVSYMFNGYAGDNIDSVHFILPEMKNKIQEGLYPAKVEVIVDNKCFTPVNFQINFKKTVAVVAESIQVVNTRPAKSEIKISAQPIVVKPAHKIEQQPILPPRPTRTAIGEAIEQEKNYMNKPKSLKDEVASLKIKRR